MAYRKTGARDFVGLDLNTAKISMAPGAAQVSENFDYDAQPGARVRAGYARLLDPSSNVVNVATAPSRVFAFERNDNGIKLVVAHGVSVEQFDTGDTEW